MGNSRFIIGKLEFSRRRLLMAVAAAAASAIDAATAQAAWQEFRRDDLGFRIEMPGRPTVEENKGLPRENWIRSLDAQVEYEKLSYGIVYTAYKTVSADEMLKQFRTALSVMGAPITESVLTVNGFPAREFIVEPGIIDGAYYRIVFVENAVITVQVVGGRHTDPSVRRFVDSFRLLAGAK